jgi:hypothetical protein
MGSTDQDGDVLERMSADDLTRGYDWGMVQRHSTKTDEQRELPIRRFRVNDRFSLLFLL